MLAACPDVLAIAGLGSRFTAPAQTVPPPPIPNVALTTDVIVGFSSETDEEFEDTMRVMEKVKFDSAFSFKYSERKNTIASKKFPDDISEEIKTQRIMRLVELQKNVALEKNRAQIGTIETLLIEEATGDNKDQFSVGRTEGNKLVVMPKVDVRVGEFIQARITDATPNVLKGEFVGVPLISPCK